MHTHDKNAGQGGAVGHPQIQGGKAERAAQLLAVDDVAGHGVVVAQQLLGFRKVAGGQRFAHGRGGDAARAVGDGGQGVHLETVLPARFLERGDGAGAAGAVAEIVAHHQPFDVQAFDQHAGGELLGRHGGELGVEMLDDDAVDAGAASEPSLSRRLAMRAGARDRSPDWAAKNSRGWGSKVITAASTPSSLAAARTRGKQCLVATVDTIEIADREGARRAGPVVGKSPEYLHLVVS